MIEPPQVLSTAEIDGGMLLRLKVPAELSYFPGHFPAHPVLPGVVQLRWIEMLAKEYGLIAGEFRSLDKLKFMRIISKDYEVELELTCPKDKTLQFQFRSSHGIHASGRMMFH